MSLKVLRMWSCIWNTQKSVRFKNKRNWTTLAEKTGILLRLILNWVQNSLYRRPISKEKLATVLQLFQKNHSLAVAVFLKLINNSSSQNKESHNREGGLDTLLLGFCFDWEDISNTRHSVSSAIQTPRISSKILSCPLFSVFGYPDETLALVFDVIHNTCRVRGLLLWLFRTVRARPRVNIAG